MCFYTGTPLQNDIVTLLLNFRFEKYGVVSDIEKAFHMIEIHPDDRKFTKFLWLEDFNDPNSDLVPYRFRVVLFGAKCSPFILNATILKHLSYYDTVHLAHRRE